MSPKLIPVRTGGPSENPLLAIVSELAWMIGSKAPRSFFGPVRPNPEIEHRMIREFLAANVA